MYVCSICQEPFHSQAVLRLHESSHHKPDSPPEASIRRRSSRSKYAPRSCAGRPAAIASIPSTCSILSLSDGELASSQTQNTVAAVRALIERNQQSKKRGEYRRYTPEIRDAIAKHALEFGTHDAVRTFTSSLGNIKHTFLLPLVGK